MTKENVVIDLLRIVQIINIDFNNNVTFNQGSIVLGNETIIEISEVTTERMEKKPKISDRNLLKYILVGLSSLVGFVCIMNIALHYYKKK